MPDQLTPIIEEFDTAQTNENLRYSPNQPYGNQYVGRAVAPHGDGDLYLVVNDEEVYGKLLEVRANGRCSVLVWAGTTIMYSSGANRCRVGTPFVGGGSGFIKSQRADTGKADKGLGLGRGIITRIIGTQAQGSPVEVLLLG